MDFVPKLQSYRLKKSEPINHSHPLDNILVNYEDHYVIMGEIINAPGHYIILNYSKGMILPGMYELYRFEKVPTEDMGVTIETFDTDYEEIEDDVPEPPAPTTILKGGVSPLGE
jgi:hypothetical protein